MIPPIHTTLMSLSRRQEEARQGSTDDFRTLILWIS